MTSPSDFCDQSVRLPTFQNTGEITITRNTMPPQQQQQQHSGPPQSPTTTNSNTTSVPTSPGIELTRQQTMEPVESPRRKVRPEFGTVLPSPNISPQSRGAGGVDTTRLPHFKKASFRITDDDGESSMISPGSMILGSTLNPNQHGSFAARRFKHNNPHLDCSLSEASFGSFNLGHSFHMGAMDSPITGGSSPGFNRKATMVMQSPVIHSTASPLDASVNSPVVSPDQVLINALKLKQEKKAIYSESSLPARFKKGPKIGSGAYACVYVGLNTWSNELVAIKELTLKNSDDVKTLEEARREFELLRKLKHKHIVQYKLFEYFAHAKVARIYLEYVSGGTTASLLRTHGPLPEGVVARIANDVLNGLSYLHDKDIIHRDIKPANILMSCDGVSKLADFGASKRIGASSGKDRDAGVYVVVGTPAYMAPETIRGETLAEGDIWALGCTIHELLTDIRPWTSLGKFPGEQQFMGAILRASQDNTINTAFACSTLSEVGMDFLKKCLLPEHHVRWTCDQLLQHPWIMNRDPSMDDYITSCSMSYAHKELTVLLAEVSQSSPAPSPTSSPRKELDT